MSATRGIPDRSIPVISEDGQTLNQAWWDYLKSRDGLAMANLRDVSAVAPTNGQVLIFNSTSKLWVPGTN